MSAAAERSGPSRPDPSQSAPPRRETVYNLLLSAEEPLSIAEISRRGELHPNTVRFHLSALTEAGRVHQMDSQLRTRGRPPLLFRAVRGMDPAGPRRYRVLAEILTAALQDTPDPTASAIRAGRAWGGQQIAPENPAATAEEDDPTWSLRQLMGDLGFAPELPAEQAGELTAEIHLRHCPFLELVEAADDIVCPLHLGLMQGALEAWKSPLTATGLQPFAEPDRCVAHLSSAAAS